MWALGCDNDGQQGPVNPGPSTQIRRGPRELEGPPTILRNREAVAANAMTRKLGLCECGAWVANAEHGMEREGQMVLRQHVLGVCKISQRGIRIRSKPRTHKQTMFFHQIRHFKLNRDVKTSNRGCLNENGFHV